MWDTGPLANQLIWFPEEGAEDNINKNSREKK